MIVREGWLLKRGEHIKNWRARYFVLMDDGSLLGFKQKPSPGQYRDPTNNFTVKGCHIIKVESATHFIFIVKGLNYEQEIERNFSAGNDHDRDTWCNAIIRTALSLQCSQQPVQAGPGADRLASSGAAAAADQNRLHLLHDHDLNQDHEMLAVSHHNQSDHYLKQANPADHPATSTSSASAHNHSPLNFTTTSAGPMNLLTQAPNSLYPSHQSGAGLSQASNCNKLLHYDLAQAPHNNKPTTTTDQLAPADLHHHHINSSSTALGGGTPGGVPPVAGASPTSTNPLFFTLGAKRELEYVQQPKKMSLDDFNPIKLIGRGSWGKVMLSREKSTGCLYAIKILKKHVIISQNEVSHTLTESRVLRTTSHPFLIALKCSFRDGERLCFVMEFAGGGELFYHLSQERKFSEEKTRFYGAEIVSALGYLHEHDIIYRDLKLENLLLGRDGHIKIADFGLCKDNIRFTDTTRTFCGTPEYLSPEVIEDNQYGRAVDWWSLGVLLYEMMCGSLPFNNRTTDLLFREILLKPVSFPATLSEAAKHFLNGLLIKDPNKRLGGGQDDAREIMIHAFFRELNWNDLIEKKIPPPFVPEISSETDTRYFDRQFTTEPVNLTPIDRPMNHLSEVDASFFTQFSYAAGSQMSHR